MFKYSVLHVEVVTIPLQLSTLSAERYVSDMHILIEIKILPAPVDDATPGCVAVSPVQLFDSTVDELRTKHFRA